MRKIQIAKKWIVSLFIVVFAFVSFAFLAPKPAQALSVNTIAQLVSFLKNIKKYYDLYKNYGNKTQSPVRIFPFGGHITHAEGGCALKYKVWVTVYIFGYPVPIGFSGVPIPLGGNTIEVGPPLKSPEGQLFIFPGVSQVYANNNEGVEGVWTLGLGFTPFPIAQINDLLDAITIRTDGQGVTTSCLYPSASPYVPYCFDSFRLDCSKDNKNVILKIGTSAPQTP